VSNASWPSVTVVVVNLDGIEFMGPCLQSLRDQEYPGAVEVIVIDNASTDGSRELVIRDFPEVQVITESTNTGFAPAVNKGARAGNGDIVALINNDATADPTWLRELVMPMRARDAVKVTGGVVLDAEGGALEFAGGALTFYGHGMPIGRGGEIPTDAVPQPVAYVTGASMAIRRDWFLETGLFDADYFAFFEDVDYGWRTWLMGGEVWLVPDAIIRHHHHGTIKRFGYARERYLLERNALSTIYKNFGDVALSHNLPAALLLAVVRAFTSVGSGLGDYAIGPDTAGTMPPVPELDAEAGAHLAALRDFGLDLERLGEKRRFVQSRRQREDRDVVRMFRHPIMGNITDPTFLRMLDAVVSTFDVLTHTTSRQRVLIVTADTLGTKMAGPAIRTWEMALLLSREHEVKLVSMHPTEITHDAFAVEQITAANAGVLAQWAEVTVVQGVTTHAFPELLKTNGCLVVDLYDPFHIEGLVQRRHDDPMERWTAARVERTILEAQMRRGDLFLCATDRQRDLWLGQLAGLGRLNPATYDQHHDLSGLLALAPFGLPDKPPVADGHPIRDRFDAIGPDDVVLLWGGGIWNWFDPVTLMKGVEQAAATDPRLKLVFLGTARPNPLVPAQARAAEAVAFAKDRGLFDKHVFFNDGWVPYDQREAWLLDADIGVTTHFQHIETQYAFRTRVLDYLWAGLPILSTGGDSLSLMIRDRDLGIVVPAEDPGAIADALLRLADPSVRAGFAANVRAVAPDLTWEKALEPLLTFARMPRRAPDLVGVPKVWQRGGLSALTDRSPVELGRKFIEVSRQRGFGTAVRVAGQAVKSRLGVGR